MFWLPLIVYTLYSSHHNLQTPEKNRKTKYRDEKRERKVGGGIELKEKKTFISSEKRSAGKTETETHESESEPTFCSLKRINVFFLIFIRRFIILVSCWIRLSHIFISDLKSHHHQFIRSHNSYEIYIIWPKFHLLRNFQLQLSMKLLNHRNID